MEHYEFVEQDYNIPGSPNITRAISDKYNHPQSYLTCVLLGLLKILIRGREDSLYSKNVFEQLKQIVASLEVLEKSKDTENSESLSFTKILDIIVDKQFTRIKLTEWLLQLINNNNIFQNLLFIFKSATKKILNDARLDYIIDNTNHNINNQELSQLFQAYCNFFYISIDYFDINNKITQFKSSFKEWIPAIFLKSEEGKFIIIETKELQDFDLKNPESLSELERPPFMYNNRLKTYTESLVESRLIVGSKKNKIFKTNELSEDNKQEAIKKMKESNIPDILGIIGQEYEEAEKESSGPVSVVKNKILGYLKQFKPSYEFKKIQTSPEIRKHKAEEIEKLETIYSSMVVPSLSKTTTKDIAGILVSYLKLLSSEKQIEMLKLLELSSLSDLEFLLNKIQLNCVFCSKGIDENDFSKFECSKICKVCVNCRKIAINNLCPKCGRLYSEVELSSIRS